MTLMLEIRKAREKTVYVSNLQTTAFVGQRQPAQGRETAEGRPRSGTPSANPLNNVTVMERQKHPFGCLRTRRR